MCFVFVYLYLWSTGTFWVNGVGEARMSDMFVLLAHTLPHICALCHVLKIDFLLHLNPFVMAQHSRFLQILVVYATINVLQVSVFFILQTFMSDNNSSILPPVYGFLFNCFSQFIHCLVSPFDAVVLENSTT